MESSLNNIVHLGFKDGNRNPRIFSVDVYSSGRRKYQFDIDAESVTAVYFRAVAKAFRLGASMIRCVVIYEGASAHRLSDQAPVKVWQQADLASASQS